MTPNPNYLLEKTNITLPLIGLYDAPDSNAFEPIITPKKGGHACVFCFYKKWLDGFTLQLTKENFGCGGASQHLFNQATRPYKDYLNFLTDDEGLKASHELMEQWLQENKSYQPEHDSIFIGPLKEDQYKYLKTVTFLVNPDQLSMLMIGAQYFASPGDPEPVIAPFGSGCMQLVSSFEDLEVPQALIGATDMAMRQYFPPEIMAFTATKSMYERLCKIDKNSFLEKGFIKNLKKARGIA